MIQQEGAQFLLDPAHQDDHQQHGNHPAAARLERLTKQGYLRQLWAGQNTCHHPAHGQRAAKDLRGVDPHQNVHDGKHGAAENPENA